MNEDKRSESGGSCMSPELEKALIGLRKVICAEHPHAIEAIIRFELDGRVEIDTQERQVSKL